MKMYLVVTTYIDVDPFCRLYKTYTAAEEDFWNRIGSYVHDWLADYTNSCNRGKISAEKTANLFEKCYAAKHNKYVSFDDRTIYIEELEAEG